MCISDYKCKESINTFTNILLNDYTTSHGDKVSATNVAGAKIL